MSITPKIIDLDGNRNLKLHMGVENPFEEELKGEINFIIFLLNGKKEKILKIVKIPKKSIKNFYINYKIKSSFKQGFYKVSAFFSYRNEKVDSSTKKNDFFLVVDTKKMQGRRAKEFIKDLKKEIFKRK